MSMSSRILESWALNRNVLLYGPPGTGKTRILSQLYSQLQDGTSGSGALVANLQNQALPLAYKKVDIPEIPGPTKTYWATFHQSFGYEDFVLGYKPTNSTNGVELQAHAGVLLDAILELCDEDSKYESAVIFIDEVNRANASRVFGEFMTFLDFDYRSEGSIPLPMPLRQLSYREGVSETIYRLDGTKAKLVEGFTFPRHIYIVATMNSVDRSAVPIDSALARRFNRIEMAPDRSVLERKWGVELDSSTARDAEFTAHEVALQLFDFLNVHIANDLGPEFELGHGLFLGISDVPQDTNLSSSDDASWISLARVWDDVLFPQLEDRYAGRPEALIQLLRVTEFAGIDYLWALRSVPSQQSNIRALERTKVVEASVEKIKQSFTLLVSERS